MIDKRVGFFVIASVASALMSFVAPGEYRRIALAVSLTYVVLAVAASLDLLSRRR